MILIRLLDGPYAGCEGVHDHEWAYSWFRVRDDHAGMLLTPGEAGRGELYVLASEGEICEYRHYTSRSSWLDLAAGVFDE